jgi:hypothetical protein
MAFKLLAVGTDTEVFFQDAQTKKPVPCIGLIGGTKEEPKPIFGGNGYAVQEDNVMAEFNIPPATTAAQFNKSIARVLVYLEKEAAKLGCKVDISASRHFTPEQLKHPQAKNIGCEPDYCVWSRAVNEFDEAKRKILDYLRTTGGHVHISYLEDEKVTNQLTIEGRELMVMGCDLTLGVPSLIFDEDHERKLLYGKAGAFRPKDYGIEYRVLSNFWVANSEYREWVFNNVQLAVNYVNDKNVLRSILDFGKQIRECINTHDTKAAKNIIATFGIPLP